MSFDQALPTRLAHPEHTEDDSLAEAARTDPSAFTRLYERHYGPVYRYCRSRTASPEDAADLAQHVFLVAYAKRERYRTTGAGYMAWLLRIARNAAIDASRRRKLEPATLGSAELPAGGARAGGDGVAQRRNAQARRAPRAAAR